MTMLDFMERCKNIEPGASLLFDDLRFEFLFWLKNNDWFDFKVYATLSEDVEMHIWNQKHPVEENTTIYTCKAGTKVRVWMVSRFRDVGITDNLVNPNGYDARLRPSKLYNWEIVKRID